MTKMRFYNKINRAFRQSTILLICLLVTGTLIAQVKPASKAGMVEVTIKVTDEAGAPLPGAQVVVGEGMIHDETDGNGSLTLKAYPGDFVTVSASGYEKSVYLLEQIAENRVLILKKSKLFMSSDDDIPLPFSTIKKRRLTGSTAVVTGRQLEKYPSTDLRNAFTGLVPGLHISESNGSPGFSAEEKNGTYRITQKIGVTARGRSLIYIIDGIMTDITEMPLDPQDIESATIVKDIVGKSMYGPAGAGGIVLIKTKRGRSNERILNVNIEDGLSVVDRMPGFVSGADYARLNNIARQADGLDANYDDDDIAAYAKNDPYDMYHPSVNFRDMMLKKSMAFRRANVSSQGGNDALQYFSSVVYDGEGDINKIGPKADYNRISARSNIDIRINDMLKAGFDVYGGLTYRRSPNYGYTSTVTEGGSQMDLVEFNSAIDGITNTPPIAFPVYANNAPSLKAPWFGVSNTYKFNPIGDLTSNGYYTETGRIGSANFTLEYNMDNIVKGLKSTTTFGFNTLNLVRLGKAENYIAYIATPSTTTGGNDTILLTKVHDGVDSPTMSNLHDYYFQRFGFYENLNFERSFGSHFIHSTLTYFIYKVSKNGIEEPQRQQNAVLTALYSFNDKYIIQGVLNYAGSNSLERQNRFEIFPTIGAGWVISEENFMAGLDFVNYLKIRAEAGILGYESFLAPYYYQERWTRTTGNAFGPFSTGRWFGSNIESTVYRTYPSRIGNPEFQWEKTKEINLGLDALLLNQKLMVEFNYYNSLRDGQISQISATLPYMAGISSALPYFNLNSTRYYGVESAIQFSENSGIIKYSFGGNATIQYSKLVKYNEPAYRNEYQFRTGTAADTYWGQKYLGKFQSDAEALEIPQLYDATLKAGDLRYADMNGDGVVDDNDQSALGHTSPRLLYAINGNIRYRNFDLTLIGTGSAFFDIALTNKYFWNGWGDNNYSNFVKDNEGGAYPRLTYYKVNNNFVASDFWLTKGDYFKIQNVELAYNVPLEKLQIIRSRGLRLYVRGSNLLTFSKVKDVDPESINSGVEVYPLFKTFTGGIKLTF
jgi:TonB-linked SusC/RagA family outer membrane protein